jgi:hypothetical protein
MPPNLQTTPKPTTVPPHISVNNGQMGTFQVPILCACMARRHISHINKSEHKMCLSWGRRSLVKHQKPWSNCVSGHLSSESQYELQSLFSFTKKCPLKHDSLYNIVCAKKSQTSKKIIMSTSYCPLRKAQDSWPQAQHLNIRPICLYTSKTASTCPFFTVF